MRNYYTPFQPYLLTANEYLFLFDLRHLFLDSVSFSKKNVTSLLIFPPGSDLSIRSLCISSSSKRIKG